MLHDPDHYSKDSKRRPRVSWGREWNKQIVTFGRVPSGSTAFVYVGACPHGRVKIGMSGDPEQRCANLNIELKYAVSVCAKASKEVETLALQSLGHDQGDGEWLRKPDVNAAVCAVKSAKDQLRKRMWVDPEVSEEEAKRRRVQDALGNEAGKTFYITPQTSRKISITSFRRAFGIKGAVGGRFG